MKHLYYLLAIALTFTACLGDEETPPPPFTTDPDAKLESIAFDRTSAQFDKENTVNLVLTVTPIKSVALNEFVLLNAGTDQIVNDITLKFTGQNDKNAGKYGVQLIYRGEEKTFTRSVEVCYAGLTRSAPLELLSRPLVHLERLAFDQTSVQLDKENTASLVLTVTPTDFVPEVKEFALLNAGTDQPVTDIALKFTGEIDKSAGKYGVQLIYTGTELTFTRSVELRYADTQIRTAPLELLSPPHTPVVYIEASAPIVDKETWIDATIRIDGGGYFDDMATTPFQIRGRGNSTWAWDKKPYAMKFPEKTVILGMPKHKRWCLIANYMDRTHMRNRIAYHIGANSNLDYTTRNQYAELYLNGRYEGLYLLTEQIKDGKDRVNISDEAGFLLEFDTNYDEDVRFRSTPSSIPINLKFPDPEDLAPERLDALKTYINQLDKAVQDLKTGGTVDPLTWLDQTSMVDFWIIFELMANHEMLHPKSVYFHKEGNGKLIAGPIWDFDYETLTLGRKTGWINYGDNLYYGAAWRESNWWVVLLKYDASFRTAVKARWQEWYPFLRTVPDFIRAEQKYITPAVARDNKRWPTITVAGVNGDADLTFDQAAARIIEVYQTRLHWIDSQIAGW